MSQRWKNNKQPDTDGNLCLIIDPEDGTHPTYIYGINEEQILEKAARTIEHGQRAITALKVATPASRPAAGALPIPGHASAVPSAPAPPARVKPLTNEETMRLTEELQDPAKAGGAVKRLFEGTTGLNVDALTKQATLQRYAQIAAAWEATHPDFPKKHKANLKLLTNAAVLKAGSLADVTAQILEQAYQELLAGGYLVQDQPDAAAPDQEEGESTLRPEETPAAVSSVAPTRTATTYRRTALRGTAPASAQPTRYTHQQIAAMSSAEILRRSESEPGFKEALAALAYTRKATA